MREGTYLLISLTLVILASFLAGFLSRPFLFDFYTSSIIADKNISEIEQCKNLSLEKSVYCLRDYVNGFYKYVLRNDTFSSLDDLKENGGDCSDYSLLYYNMAKDLGLNSQLVNLGTAHIFAIIWDKNLTGYCKTEVGDSRSIIDCTQFEIGNERRLE